jgi:multidrug resistance efflux pump
VLTKSKSIARLPWVLFMGIALLPTTKTVVAQATATITTELAAQHLFARIADGPKAASWAVRTKPLAEIGLAPAQIQQTVQAANAFIVANAKLAAQANAIHQSIKERTLSQSSGLPQLRNLDQQRDGLIVSAIAQLTIDLGPDGWYRLENYLNTTVKPSIVFVP